MPALSNRGRISARTSCAPISDYDISEGAQHLNIESLRRKTITLWTFLSTYKQFSEHRFAYICALTQRVAETGTSDLQFNRQDAPAASNYI